MALTLQVLVSSVVVALTAVMYGRDSAVSAAFGGGVPVVAGLVYGAVAALSPPAQAPLEALRGILRAESAKVLTVVVLLWMVFKFGAAMQPVAFFVAFILSVFAFSTAALFRDR